MGHLTENKITNSFICYYLFVFFLSIYLLTASGINIEMTDVGTARMEVAKSIIERFDLSIPSGLGLGIQGSDGREYSVFSIGSVLVALPFYLIGKFAGVPPVNVVTIVNQLAGTATVVVVFLFCSSLGYTRRASLSASIFYGLGTFAWYYAKDPGDHTLETLWALLSVYTMYRYAACNKLRYLCLSSIFLGFAFLTRSTSILLIPPLLLLMGFQRAGSHDKANVHLKFSHLLLFISLLLPFAGIIFLYNYYRFGSIFETGYTLMAARLGLNFFSATPLLTGLLGLLVSPGKGYFYYSPVALLFFFSVKPFYRKHPAMAISFICIIASYLFFISKNVYWHGDSAWGPRYLFVITPFLIIPLAALFDSAAWHNSSLVKRGIYTLFALSLIIQVAAVSVHVYKYFVFLHEKNIPFTIVKGNGVAPICEPCPETYFDWRLAPIAAQVKFVGELSKNLINYKHIEHTEYGSKSEKIMSQPWTNIFDFWWLYKYYAENSFAGLIVAALLLMSCILSALRLRKAALL
jgi:Dolichyl-phosphate-mannose-protein mannosyltransferase